MMRQRRSTSDRAYWFGVLLLFVAAVAGYAGIWTAFPLGAIGLYFLVSNWK